MKTINLILTGLVSLVSGWAPNNNLMNDLADGILLLNTAHSALPGSPLVNAALKFINSTNAGILNVASGQLAVVGSETVSFPGYGQDEVEIFAVRKYRNGGAPDGSPAATIKALSGT